MKIFWICLAGALVMMALGVIGTAHAQSALLTCSNGSVEDTTTVRINGRTATVTGRGSGSVQIDPAFYRITLPNGGSMSINRESGHALVSGGSGTNQRTVRLMCRPGGPRM